MQAQRRQAVRVLSGSVGQKVDGWRRDLIRAGALLEATIDFADEDVPGGATAFMMQQVVDEQGAWRYLDSKPQCLSPRTAPQAWPMHRHDPKRPHR